MATIEPNWGHSYPYPNITVTNGTITSGTSTATIPWPPCVTSDTTTVIPNTTNIQKSLKVSGPASFEDDILLRGKSLSDTIEKIEERLVILHPNTVLESRWEELRELRKRYQELEKDILEKEKMWDIIKK
jgi:hypothetical protein